MKNLKILIYALSIIILAGIIVILLKGFNVDLMLRSHDEVNFVVQNEFDVNVINEIAKQTFKDKKFVIRKIEIFNDGFSINADNITEEEKENLKKKIAENYGIDEDRDIVIENIPAVRLRDIVKPYITPGIICAIAIYIYYLIRFYKFLNEKIWVELLKSIGIVIFVNLAVASIIAITRIPVSTIIPPIFVIISLVSVITFFEKSTK